VRGGSAEEVRRSREKRAFSDSIGKMRGVSQGDKEKDEQTNRIRKEFVRGSK